MPRARTGIPAPLAFGACAAGLVLALAGAAFAQSSPNVALDHPSGRLLEFLDTLGLLDSRIQGIRPVTRLEAARLLVEASDLGEVRPDLSSALLRARITLFRDEFRAEADALLEADGGEGATFFKPLQSVYARYTYFEGTETPEGDFGRVLNQGSQAFAGLSTFLNLADLLCLHARPEARLHFHNWEGRPEDRTTVRWLETYAKLTLWNVEIEGGLDSLTWGQGAHDTLILSHDAEPLPVVKIGNPMPSLLPWIFEALGPVRAQFFLTRLDGRRAVSKPWMAGMKVSLKPLPFLEFGVARTFVFGGDDRPPPDWWAILKGTEDNPHAGEPDLANQLAGFDLRLRLPLPGGGLAYYVEAVGEDEAGAFPYKWSFLHGVHVAGLLPARNLWLRVEWAKTHGAAYVHGTYATGYTYRLNYEGHTFTNSALGHHVGNNAEDVFAEIGLFLTAATEVAVFGDWESRRPGGAAVPEEHVQWGASFRHRLPWLGGFTVSGEFRTRITNNADHVLEARETDSWVLFTVELQF